ncbi:MAG: SUF system NifU family Fe-S cluster assembly protein [Bifidobacteriaceae bacterium]|jgi:nitrogen fixation NifU-like protein|nr:SUF system NifU family Fe-S cluster assembly protein [Bifidobacteriaceae bacterium]
MSEPSGLESLYRELILDHYRRPRGKDLAPTFDAESFQVNPVCGDEVRLRVKLGAASSDELGGTDILGQVTWTGTGCSISQASTSVMCELVRGEDLGRVAELEAAFGRLMHSRGLGLESEADEDALGDAIAFEGVAKYPARVKCALLGWMALKDALAKAVAGDSSPAPGPKG